MVDGGTDTGRRTDDGACLYYKLTNEPKGSGELKIYNINSVICCCCLFFFLQKFGFYRFHPQYKKLLIFPGYDINKCERLCIGVSAFNLAREFWWIGHGGVTRVGSWGMSHCYTWAYNINRLRNPVTY